jgi:non-specific serine/threonine protein kinase/serine/threonine-protein kinase
VTPETYGRAKEIFLHALEAPEGARAALVAARCGGDEALRREVEALLFSEQEGAGFLDRTPLPPLPADGEEEPAPPPRVGPYRIVGEIGRGGMGSVYLAERADDTYAGRVAVKLVRRGMDTEDILRRFRTERQILASLQHPNIARLLDGGTTEDGRPYFVMEHIEGRTLTEDARAGGRSLADRIALFRVVCGAVQHAHGMLVVHRDIKPSNVLVTGDGTVKLLDFGLAKVLSAPAAAGADLTTAATAIFTPEYTSPEQLAGRAITTSADVYSLGVMLYELLADAHPYRDAAGSPALLWRAVCEEDPSPPSAAAERGRGPDVGRRAAALRGDLDAIVLKAMRKEPQRRYATVDQLSEDLRRHLDGLPVEARPESAAYRLGKFVRRHRGVATAAVIAVLSLAAGLGVALYQTRIARAHEAVAKRRLEDVRALANTLLFELNESLVPVPGTTKARELLVRRGLEYLQRLDPKSGPEDLGLQRDVAAGYEKLADVQGGGNSSLGDAAGARESRRLALALRERTAGSREATLQDRLDLALARADLAEQLGPGSEEALRLTESAVRVAEEAFVRTPADRKIRKRLAIVLDARAMVLSQRGNIEGALAARRREAELFDLLAAEPEATDNDRRNQALVSRYLASLYDRLGRSAEAEREQRRALEIDEARLAAAPRNAETMVDASHSLRSLAASLRKFDRLDEALPLAERAAALSGDVAAKDLADVGAQLAALRARLQVAQMYTSLGRLREGRRMILEGIARLDLLVKARVTVGRLPGDFGAHRIALAETWEMEMQGARGKVREAARREALAAYGEARRTYDAGEAIGLLSPSDLAQRDRAVRRLAGLAREP